MVNSRGQETTFVSTGDWVPLTEAAIGDDGTIPICIINTGWSLNGRHYSEDVLRAAAPLYKTGTHNYWNHPGPNALKEQPTGDLNAIASVFTEDARYLAEGDEGAFNGPGLYTRVRPVSAYAERIRELAGVIGLSHRVLGRQVRGVAEGRSGAIVQEIFDPAKAPGRIPPISVDWVAHPAAGGAALVESEIIDTMTDEEFQERVDTAVTEATAPLNEQITAKDAEIATLKEELETLRRESAVAIATVVLREELANSGLPEAAAKRVEASHTFTEGAFDTETYRGAVKTAVDTEKAYIEAIAGPRTQAPPPNPGVPMPEGEQKKALALARELREITGR